MEDGIYIVNQSYDITYVNPSLIRDFGPYDGKKCYEYFHERQNACSWCEITDVFDGKTRRWEWYSPKNQKTYDLIDSPLINFDGSKSKLVLFRDITERKQTEKALGFTQFSIDKTADAAFWMGPDARFIYVNEAACRSLGYSREELLSMTVHDIDPDFPVEIWLDHWKDVRERGSFTIESRHRAKSGKIFPVELTINFLLFEGKEYNCAFAHDITERRLTQESLKLSQISVNSSSIAIFWLDESANFFYVNEAACLDLDYTREELLSMSVFNISPRLSEEIWSNLWKELKIAKKLTYETFHLSRKGRIFPVDLIINYTEFSEKGYAVGFAKDITERKQVERELYESQIRFKALFKGGAVPSYIWQKIGEDFILADYNIAADTLTLGDIKKYLGFKATEMYRERSDLREDLKQCFEEKSILIRERKFNFNILKENRDLIITYSFIPPDLVLAQSEDITERKKAEQGLKISRENYREAFNRAEFYKDLFAHDISNILQNIWSSIDLFSIYFGDENKTEDIYKLIRIAVEQIKRGATLCSNVRKLSELENREISLKSVEVGKVLNKAVENIKNGFLDKDRKIIIKTDAINKNIYIEANELLIDVFENILFNAIKHNKNSIIQILIKILNKEKADIQYLKLEFSDNGIGIPDEMKENIFQRVYSEKKNYSRIGLGLSLVKKIIETYNGQIWVEDKVRGDFTKGSNFILLIPLVNDF